MNPRVPVRLDEEARLPVRVTSDALGARSDGVTDLMSTFPGMPPGPNLDEFSKMNNLGPGSVNIFRK